MADDLLFFCILLYSFELCSPKQGEKGLLALRQRIFNLAAIMEEVGLQHGQSVQFITFAKIIPHICSLMQVFLRETWADTIS